MREFCVDCHDGVSKPLDFHGNDYMSLHTVDARRQSLDCGACHRLQTFCTGCHACERACPVECMTVVMKDNPKFGKEEGDSKRRKIVDEFYIDYGRCMRCNICVEVCNFDAIAMNNTWAGHELSSLDRKDLVLDLDQLMSLSKSKQIRPWVPS